MVVERTKYAFQKIGYFVVTLKNLSIELERSEWGVKLISGFDLVDCAF